MIVLQIKMNVLWTKAVVIMSALIMKGVGFVNALLVITLLETRSALVGY